MTEDIEEYKIGSEGSITLKSPLGSSIIINGEDGLANLLRIIRAAWAEGDNFVVGFPVGGRVIFEPDKSEAK